MDSLNAFAADKLASIDARNLRRRPIDTHRVPPAHAVRDGRRLVEMCGNDYLSLTHDPAVKAAAADALERYGTGAAASRLVTGNHPLLCALEGRLAAFHGSDDCVVFGSGYLTNAGVIPCLVGPRDLVLLDALSHACLHAGAQLAGSERHLYRHGDMNHLAELLRTHRGSGRRCLVATDGVFSMDGDVAQTSELAALCEAHDAWLLIDDAHGLGVLGSGRGALAAAGTLGRVPLLVGTLSKVLASYGGYLCTSRPVADLVRTRARSLIYTTGLPPAAVAAALAALDRIEADPDLCERPLALARRFAAAVGLPAPSSPIVPIVLGDSSRALSAGRDLEARGFLITAIRPPTVPAGTARLRITFAAGHSEAEVDALAAAVADLGLR